MAVKRFWADSRIGQLNGPDSVTLKHLFNKIGEALDRLLATVFGTPLDEFTKPDHSWLDGGDLDDNSVGGNHLQAAVVVPSGKALRSADYDAGVEGWQIDGDGNVEVNDGTFRGALEIGTGNPVTLDDADGLRLPLWDGTPEELGIASVTWWDHDADDYPAAITVDKGDGQQWLSLVAREVGSPGAWGIYLSADEAFLSVEGTDGSVYVRPRLVVLDDGNSTNITLEVANEDGGSAAASAIALTTNGGATTGYVTCYDSAYSIIPAFSGTAGFTGQDGVFLRALTSGGYVRFFQGGNNEMFSMRVVGGAAEVRFPTYSLPAITGNTAIYNTANRQLGYSTSSIRHKQNVVPLSTRYHDVLHRVRPVWFQWRDSVVGGGGLCEPGFIAEEVREVVPEAVTAGPDGEATGLNDRALLALLWGEVQRLSARVAELEG